MKKVIYEDVRIMGKNIELFFANSEDLVVERLDTNKQRWYLKTKILIPKGKIKVAMKIVYYFEKNNLEDKKFDEKRIEVSFPYENKPVVFYLATHTALLEEGVTVYTAGEIARKIEEIIK